MTYSVTVSGTTFAVDLTELNYSVTLSQVGQQGATGATGDVSSATDGTAASPAISFTSDEDTGFFRPSADTLGVAAGGTQVAQFTTTGLNAVAIGATTPSTGSFTTVSVSGTVDGRDVSVDGAKLDGIEAGADVTDTANVTAAGALMDSEVANLAAVKAFDPADYATAVQGDLADTALQADDIGVTVQGYSAVLAATTASFTTADETKLDGIEALADVTDTANVTAAGALMDSEVTNLAAVKALNQGVATTDSPTFVSATIGDGTVVFNGNEINALQLTLADDAAAELTFPSRQGGLLWVTLEAQGAFPQANNFSGLVVVDFGSSPFVSTPIYSGSSFETNNSGELTGTTGTDGSVTVGTAGTSGTLYIENRSNGNRKFQITLL
jgi:hypothetical protein